jgi:putative ABC transport system permease protein
MPLTEILRIAFASIGVNKLRSILTMLGITIGVFSVIGVMTVLSFLGSNFFQFGKYPTGLSGGTNRREIEMRRDITLAQAMRYKELMADVADVVCLKVFDYGGTQAVYEGRKTTPDVTLVGTNEYFVNANQYAIGLGRNLQPEDIELGRPMVVIGQDIVTKLFPSENPLGKVIKMKQRTYVVVGTFEAKGTSFGQGQDNIAIIPITRFFSDFGAEHRSVNIATEAPSHLIYNDLMDKGVTAMRVVRGLKPADPNDFEVYSNESVLAAFAKVADVVTAGSFVISGIALLAAGVGIMNIMLVSVTERTKEIGIRKSIGARKKSILTQFLIEAVAISLAGGVLGIVLGVGAGDAIAALMKVSIVFPWDWVLLGLVVCSGIGVSFGFYPAWKAASLDPIEALRYE